MGLFLPALTFTLNDGEVREFFKPPVKDEGGGPQDLYHWLKARVTVTSTVFIVFATLEGELTLEDEELLKVRRYAQDYGGGGYQGAFRAVLSAAWRAGWDAPPSQTDAHDERPDCVGRRWAGGQKRPT